MRLNKETKPMEVFKDFEAKIFVLFFFKFSSIYFIYILFVFIDAKVIWVSHLYLKMNVSNTNLIKENLKNTPNYWTVNIFLNTSYVYRQFFCFIYSFHLFLDIKFRVSYFSRGEFIYLPQFSHGVWVWKGWACFYCSCIECSWVTSISQEHACLQVCEHTYVS